MARIGRTREARLRGTGLHSSGRIGQIPSGAMSTFQVISLLTIPLAIIGLISAGRRPGAYLEVGRK